MLDVILCTYNSENTIKKCLDSILQQTFTNFKLYIFDDHSTDSTINIIKAYDDNRISTFQSPHNIGTYCGKNYILHTHCKNDFIALHDSDDWSEPTRFEKQLKFLRQNNFHCVGTAVKEYITNDQTSHTISDEGFNNECRINTYVHKLDRDILYKAKDCLLNDYDGYLKLKFCMNGTMMFTKNLLKNELGGWYSSTRIGADTDIFIRTLAQHNIYNLQEQLYCRMFHPQSLTASKKYGIKSKIRKDYNLSRLPIISDAIRGITVKQTLCFQNLDYKKI